jgi:hypothetical protein
MKTNIDQKIGKTKSVQKVKIAVFDRGHLKMYYLYSRIQTYIYALQIPYSIGRGGRLYA